MKIRYFGFLGHANKKVSIPLLRLLIDPESKIAVKLSETVQEMMMRLTGVDLSLCPECGKGKMVCIEVISVSSGNGSLNTVKRGVININVQKKDRIVFKSP
jgi:hypothetical protein